ncbi:MAG: hypothetical protein Q8L48_07830 [Archangium sp.]|nr:hypothetical protein [Archangium sp.]
MIVFNLLAIVVGLIIGICLGPLYWAFPDFMETTWGNVLAAGVVTVVGIVTDLVGLKGRVFWLPIWFFGLVGMGVNLHTQWGWWGPALAGALVVVLFGGLLAMGAVHERKEWAEAPGNLNAAKESLAKGVNEATWELLGKAYFVPAWGDDTPERCRHNLEVLAMVRKALPPTAGGLEVRVIDALAAAYSSGMAGGEKVSVPSEFTSAMQEMLGNHGALPEEEDRKDLIEALDKPVAAAA